MREREEGKKRMGEKEGEDGQGGKERRGEEH